MDKGGAGGVFYKRLLLYKRIREKKILYLKLV